jgi:sporulation delaying protein B
VLTRLAIFVTERAQGAPISNVVGVARTLLAVGTALTLAASSTETLFRPAFGLPPAPYCHAAGAVSLFCVIPREHLDLARLAAVAILLIVASGWRPRWTAVPHWWVSFSIAGSITIPDGGDQVTTVITMLLIPVVLADGRRWHWSAPTPTGPYATLLARSGLFVIRLQVAGIYLHASLAKLAVPEWQDGTALYYWLSDPAFGPAPWLRALVLPIVSRGFPVALMTWGPVALEFCLAVALVLDKRHWRYLLLAGVGFHIGIALLMGLVSFALAMCAALVLYLRPMERPFGPFSLRLRGLERAPTRTEGMARPRPVELPQH